MRIHKHPLTLADDGLGRPIYDNPVLAKVAVHFVSLVTLGFSSV
jgi:hypothetical protein